MTLARTTGYFAILGLVWPLVIAGCDRHEKPATGPSAAAAFPSDLFVDHEPAGAKSVEQVKAGAKAGDTVTIHGVIGGSLEPFVEGRAVLTLMGTGLKPCGADSPMPDCETPWDYCCDPHKEIVAHSATIQVVDAAGAPLRVSLKGQKDMKELSELVAVGEVKQIDKNILVINASRLYVR